MGEGGKESELRGTVLCGDIDDKDLRERTDGADDIALVGYKTPVG